MRTGLIIILVFITQQTSFTQDCDCLLKIPDLNIHEKNNKMLSDSNKMHLLKKEKYAETPLHLGIEYGLYVWDIEYLELQKRYIEQDEIKYSIIGYFDFNLYARKLFGKLEIGGMTDKDWHEGGLVISLGFNFNIFDINRSHFYTFIGVNALIGGWIVFCWVVNPKYVFSITNYLGVSVNLRYYRANYPRHFFIPSLGIQFFL